PTTESTKYDENNPVVINEDVTIKAIAYKGGKASEVVTAQYTVLPYIESLIALADAPSGAKFEMGTKLTVVYSDYYKKYNYVYDGTSYSLIFKPGGLALKSGDVINAGWIGKYEINSEGRPQIEPQETIVVIEEGADIPEPAEVTENEFDQLLIEGNANQYYILKNVYIDENAVENYAYWGDEYRGQMGTKYPILYSKTLGVRPYAAGYYDVTGFVDVNYNASYGGYYARLLPTKLDQYIEIGDAKMATFSSKYPLDFTKSDVRAYIATESTGNAVKFERIYKVPAETGLLLQTDAKGVYYVPNLSDDDTPETFGTNYMKAAVETTYVYDTDWVYDYDTYEYIIYTNYLLAYDKDNVGTVAFHPIKTNSYYVLDGGKAYLSLLPSTTSESGQMRIVFDDEEATGIEAVNCEEVESGDAYNLQGIKVDSNYKGFVIKNGKKFYNR
ncbi:MAG: chitobiase/beta-hexosaminidase C-terminal domain-containing protein, partial [Veillonella sp.]|nr:chitobiase/beta-hexosaminidase C-terminal domain-containing protein [Veillonella sp.]